jgi:TRAP-type uncharacterized transport system substrate-binding protein
MQSKEDQVNADLASGKKHPTGFARLLAPFIELLGLSKGLAIATVILLGLLIGVAVYWFFRLAPPHTITITAGSPDSSFYANAEKYRKILGSNGVELRILSSEGSFENLSRLGDPKFKVDIGFVQGGITNDDGKVKLVSLGSLAYQPLLVFYRSESNMTLLSELSGKGLAIGPPGSGTRSLALTLLNLNGIETNGPTKLLDLDAEKAAKALLAGEADAIFLMGDSASSALMRQLLRNPEIRMYDFTQADGYTRRVSYLNKLELPKGSLDFGKNLPSHDIYLIGPTVELLARHKLHPALCDLLIEAAQEVHGGAGLLRRKGEFPAPLEHSVPLSAEALRYYKSGKSFLYRSLPFWLASVVNRILVVFVPLAVLLIPAVKFVPALFQLKTRLLFYSRYRALLALERDLRGELSAERRKELMARLDNIERSVNTMNVPTSFAGQFYGLRGHIDFVRERLVDHAKGS